MKRECDRVIPEIFEPLHHILNGFNAHYGRIHLRTPAIAAFGRTAESGDDHDVKWPFLFHHFLGASLKY
jgi:hypothetical protein